MARYNGSIIDGAFAQEDLDRFGMHEEGVVRYPLTWPGGVEGAGEFPALNKLVALRESIVDRWQEGLDLS